MQPISQCLLLEVDWAAWSAIATFFAAAVALYVGLKPQHDARKAKERIAMSALKLLVAEATHQQFHVGAAVKYLLRSDINRRGYAHAYSLAFNLNDAPFREMLPHLDVYPDPVAEAITACAAMLAPSVRILQLSGTKDSGFNAAAEMAGSLQSCLNKIFEFRQVAGELIGQPPKNGEEAQQMICDAIVANAKI